MITIYSVGSCAQAFYVERVMPALGATVPVRLVQHDGDQIRVREFHAGRIVEYLGRSLENLIAGDVLVVWNGLISCYAPVVAMAKARGMRVVFLEYGPFVGTYQMDSRGTNGASTIAGLPPSAFVRYPHHWSYDKAVFPDRQQSVPHWREPIEGDRKPLPHNYILIPLQTHGDTQLEIFSPLQTMADFLRVVVPAIPDIPIVVSLHPWEPSVDQLAALAPHYPHIHWCRSIGVNALLGGASAVVTINGTVGLQAMARGIPVVTLGQAYYAKSGLTSIAPTTTAGVADALARCCVDRDTNLIGRFLTYLWSEWLVHHEDIDAIVQRIMAIGQHTSPWLDGLQLEGAV
jgi:capsular polysaccharide export protein